ncbi:hypothetical protein SAMN05216525_109139 [Bradyrhizobium sp. Gha]|nr:hypothetical protein SAMN05216525_109139 [Bradyrhizobium sp. Gha]
MLTRSWGQAKPSFHWQSFPSGHLLKLLLQQLLQWAPENFA